jgi:protease I
MFFRKILTLSILIILLSGCSLLFSKKQPSANNMALQNKKVLMVVAPINFRDEEYTEPRKVLEASGAEIKTASIQSGTARGVGGTEAKIDLTVSDVSVSDFDAVAFIGGPGMAEIVGDESLQILARKFYDAGKLTTAICVAPSILAKAGILKGKQATSFSSVEKDLEDGGALYTGKDVAVDGKIITANGPEAAKKFGERIVEALK